MLLSVIKRRFPIVVVSVSLLMGLLLLNIQPGTAFAQSPSITLNPFQGPPGTLVNATGSSWTPGDTIQVTWDDGSSLGSTTINTSGNFLVSFTVPNAAPGAHTVNFKDTNTGFSLTATFTVV